MKKRKLKLIIFINELVKEKNLQLIIGSFLMLGLFLYKKIGNLSINDLIDFTIITSIFFVYVIKFISNFLSKYFLNIVEDYMKLSNDYNGLIKKYPLENDIFVYDNYKSNIKDKFDFEKKLESKPISDENKHKYKFPILVDNLIECKSLNIFDDSFKWYEQPEVVKNNFQKLFEAHKTSSLYNQTNIRLDKIKLVNTEVNLFTSRTTYYDSMVTNRVMDYKIINNISLRDLINPGPFLFKLEESKLSNHIGFNVFVKTNQDCVIFINRNMDVSIGKGTYGPSVAASLKTRYCLNEELVFTKDKFIDAIINEINDELGLNVKVDEMSIENNLIAFYRDLIEGGKPQFLFKLDVDKSNDEIKTLFHENLSKKDKKYQTIQDGNKLIFLNVSDSTLFYIAPEAIFYDHNRYLTLPTVSGTFAFYLNNVVNRNENS